ncbi:MarR family transcriptional regulator [Acetobacter fabarum]|uniref:MarR family transcriptional regulator n=1 Tax=Acetobacter fabarum TaxID=483199 RepID=UPI000BF0F777|nr:helix-turn-helix domain-containing protein [Acetobacter fabarum]PEN27550.1 hypothetical protein CRM93_05330 [Acetobacter fabarum]
MKKSLKKQTAFDPYLERIVLQPKDLPDRIHTKLSDHYAWCFCEFCGNPTEYSAILEAPKVIKRLKRGNAKIVPLTETMYTAAQERAHVLTSRYEQACEGKFGPYEAARMLMRYCNIIEMQGDRSADSFREQVERKFLLDEWAKHGKAVWATKLPGQTDKDKKPSKLYCENHNPQRSDNARRAYQRDRRFISEYNDFIEKIWSHGINSGSLPTWDIEAHAYVRKEAYRQVQFLKSPTIMIDDFLKKGSMTQAEIARKLGVSRQAVSAAIKRRAKKSDKCH